MSFVWSRDLSSPTRLSLQIHQVRTFSMKPSAWFWEAAATSCSCCQRTRTQLVRISPSLRKNVSELSDQSAKGLFNMQTHKAVRHSVKWDLGALRWKRHHEIDDETSCGSTVAMCLSLYRSLACELVPTVKKQGYFPSHLAMVRIIGRAPDRLLLTGRCLIAIRGCLAAVTSHWDVINHSFWSSLPH